MGKETGKKVRVAMIGAGGMANSVHYPSLASFDDVEIAAICDLDTERLNDTADKYQVEKRYTDYRNMVKEIAPDAVYAIGQPHIMYDNSYMAGSRPRIASSSTASNQDSSPAPISPMPLRLWKSLR